jgi:hypothetical protein
MKHFRSMTFCAAVFLGLVPAAASAISIPFTATLNGAQEVPARDTPAIGSATGLLTGDPGAYALTYTVTYSGLTGPIAAPFAHIHNAAFGSNGPIVHDLDGASLPPIAGSTSGVITGDWLSSDATRPLTDALVTQFLAGNLYFNIHTVPFPGGEIRGQLSAVPEPSSALLALIGAVALGFALRKRQA